MKLAHGAAGFALAAAGWAGGGLAVAGPDAAETADSPTITVYADRDRADPGAYAIASADDIETTHANHAAEVLNTLPGVNVQMNSGQETLVAIRSPVLPAGAGQGSFLLLENGVPTRAAAFGNVNALFELHHETAEAIEVVRGPGSVRYGSNAVHGLVNVIAPEPGGKGARLSVSASTLQRYRADGVANLDLGAAGAALVALSVMDDGGWRDASGVDQQKLTVRTLHGGEGWRAVSTLSAVNLQQETAGFAQGPGAYRDRRRAELNPNPEAWRDAWSARASVRVEVDAGADAQLVVTPFAIVQRMDFIQHFLPDQSLESNSHDSAGVLASWTVEGDRIDWTIGGDLQWASGDLAETQQRASFGAFPQGLHYDYTVDTLAFSGHAEAAWRLAPGWRLLAGLRAEHHDYDYATALPAGTTGRFRVPPSRKDSFDLPTPKLGVTWSLSDVELFANYARGERAPQSSDLYRLQNQQTIETLDVETLDSLEIGARGKAAGIDFELAGFAMQKENFFFRDSDGLNVPDGATDHVGVEARMAATWGPVDWRLSAGWSDHTYAFTRDVAGTAEDIRDGDRIDTAPEWLADAAITWRSPAGRWTLSGEYVGDYATNAANTATYDGHVIAHLRGEATLAAGLEGFVIIRNLTDTRYADRADFGFGQDRYFPGEPLNATFGVRLIR